MRTKTTACIESQVLNTAGLSTRIVSEPDNNAHDSLPFRTRRCFKGAQPLTALIMTTRIALRITRIVTAYFEHAQIDDLRVKKGK